MTEATMTEDRWLLPEGIEETLPEQAARLERLRREILDLFGRWGYELVMPPFIDYLESLLTGTGRDLDLQTFKLTDQLTGRMMGVRADMTPQVARIDAHHLKRETPVRLCYMGTVLLTRPEGIARSRSPLQVGAELYGFSGVESDVEILQLMLETLSITGIRDVHLDLGHVGIFRGLARQAGLTGVQEGTLFDALQRKAGPEIRSLLTEWTVDPSAADMFAALLDLNGDVDALDDARKVLGGAGTEVLDALEDLQRIAATLGTHRPGIPLYFDLAELRGYTYHTGVVFAAYLSGHGESIAQGGRYDDIGRVFGRARPATGFSIDLRTLLYLNPEQEQRPGAIFAPAEEDTGLRDAVHKLRESGERVICGLPGQIGGAREMGCDRELRRVEGRWVAINLDKQG